MIAYLSGKIFQKSLRGITLLVNGVGYRVHLPLTDLDLVGKTGENASIHVFTHVREDALVLYGFLSEASLELFKNLLNVSGIGPKLALAMLSHMNSNQLTTALMNGDHRVLTNIPGVGNKTAQRLVLELRDRIKTTTLQTAQTKENNLLEDLRSAIINLGYKTHQVDKAIQHVRPFALKGAPLEGLVTQAIQYLS